MTIDMFLLPWRDSYRWLDGVADEEARLGREVLIRDEAYADLIAFGQVSRGGCLQPTPAAQDAPVGRILQLNKVVPQKHITFHFNRNRKHDSWIDINCWMIHFNLEGGKKRCLLHSWTDE